MKEIIIALLLILSLHNVFGQTPQIDSLNKILSNTKEDTTKVLLLAKLSFYDPSFEHGLDLAEKGIALSKKIDYEKGEVECLLSKAGNYWWISNFPMALHYHLQALKISEGIRYQDGISQSYNWIGVIYKEQGDLKKAIEYLSKASSSIRPDNLYWLGRLNADFGEVYRLLNKQDSALKYYQKSYEYFTSINDKFQFNIALNGLGNLQFNMGNNELALGYYREAIRNGNNYDDPSGLSYTYLNIANLYNKLGHTDSSISYAEKSLANAQKINVLQNVITSGKLLSKLYENKNDKLALRYLQTSQAANDSLFSRERTMEIQNMSFNETQREQELIEKEKKDDDYRKQNIQLALIAFGIITLLIIFLLLSRSIITNTKMIEFLGVIALLIVFEFLNLLLHPFLERVTHHSPILMLLALVCMAALLVPLHHRLEKWATAKLIDKNKSIRLANAKRTIEQLDKKPDNL